MKLSDNYPEYQVTANLDVLTAKEALGAAGVFDQNQGNGCHARAEWARTYGQRCLEEIVHLRALGSSTSAGVTEEQTPRVKETETQQFILKAMARNYSKGHSWDKLDAEACLKAAEEIRTLRAALEASRAPVSQTAMAWAVERWRAEVANRPLVNVHRRGLDTAWRQVIRHFGGDDEALCGPRHDDLVAANPELFRAPVSQKEAVHPDDLAVDRFATAMKAKLAKKREEGRGGWDGPTCNDEILSIMLRKHVRKGDPVDVANLAMMLHQRGEGIV
jgi:hypothetical protein